MQSFKAIGQQWLFFFLTGAVLAFSVNAAEQQNSAQATPDVRVVIDVSGSMKQNDPQNLRRPALELLVQLLPKQSKAGVWTFGELVNMLVSHGLADDQWRKLSARQANKINSVALYTNIGGALEKAAYDFDQLGDDYRTSVILLTDGVVDISKNPADNQRERERILQQILPQYVKYGVTIHTIALSQHADRELLERLAIDTGGIAAIAQSADDLMKIFLRAFDDAVPEEQVPLEGNKFLIDSSIEEFTTLVFHKKTGQPTAILAPDGTRYVGDKQDKDVRWYHADDYDLITVERPLEGEWEILADADPDNRVTVVSNLSLNVNRLPRNVFLGNLPNVSVSLTENGKVIQGPEFLGLLDIAIDVYSIDGQKRWRKTFSGSKDVPVDGNYAATLSMLTVPGDYEVTVDVDGKTFQRSNTQRITLRDAFNLVISDMTANGEEGKRLTVSALNSQFDQDSASVLARIKKPSGRTLIKTVVKSADRQWQLAIRQLDETGTYKVTVEIEGTYQDGTAVQSAPQSISFEHDAGVPAVATSTSTSTSTSTTATTEPIPAEPEKPVVIPDSEPENSATSDAHKEVESLAEPEEQTEPEEESGGSDVLLYGGLILVNLLIIGLGYMAYRMVAGGGKSPVLEDDSGDNAEIDAEPVETGENPLDELTLSEPASKASSSNDDDPLADLDDLIASVDMGGENTNARDQTDLDAILDLNDEIIEIAPDEDNDKK